MTFLDRLFGREHRSVSIESPTVGINDESFMSFMGMEPSSLPNVTIDSALTVPAVTAAVSFLSSTLASLPRHTYKRTAKGAARLNGKTELALSRQPNPLMDKVKFDKYMWQQVFTGGRGMAWIERNGSDVVALWPMDPTKTSVRRVNQTLRYKFENKEYDAEDVIDIPFMLKPNQVGHYGPINLAKRAIQLALAMNNHASQFFHGGGIPPLALKGPLPEGAPAMQRAINDIKKSVDAARVAKVPIFMLPPGHELVPIGHDPEKGQMTGSRLFQVQEIARVYDLPPVFLQDLSQGVKANAEQQDLQLVKYVIGQWAAAYEGEINLKVFGRGNTSRYVKHVLDGLLRGDFKSRTEGFARAIQTAQKTPNEVRALEDMPPHNNPAADELLIQGATVVLGTSPVAGSPVPPKEPPSESDPSGDDDDKA